MTSWKETVVSPATPLADAIARIDASALQAALVLNEDGTLAGIVTDGDVRRSILRGQGVNIPVSHVMHANATVVPFHTMREDMLVLMQRNNISHLPLVDGAGLVVGLVTLRELVGATERPNWVVLMAGGLGTRLQPLTDNCPKPLLPIGGKPILETIVESFAGQGFTQIFLSVNYKADMIRAHFGSGKRWGVRIEYLNENTRLGTAGALSLLPSRPSAPLVVMNGDLLIQTNFDNLLQFHAAQGAHATMAVSEYDFPVPYGVVRVNGTGIEAIEEKPVQKFLINAGIYVLSPPALDHIPADTLYDMPSLFTALIATGVKTAAFPLREYWLDIGRHEEFERAQRDWAETG